MAWHPRRPLLDSTLPLLAFGYGWLPDRWRRTEGPMVHARVFGRPAVALRGPEAVRFFYDERHVRRAGVAPEPVLGTLFGKGGVQGLDGPAHRVRRALFRSLLADPGRVDDLVERVCGIWDDAVPGWARRTHVVVFDEASRILTRGVCSWAGTPVRDHEVGPLARDLVALVDGFATPGPRHWRARLARGRQQERLAHLVTEARAGRVDAPTGTALAAVAHHRDADGSTLEPTVAAVELLNVLRPTVAVSWFLTYAAHALHRWPEHRGRLRADDPAFAEAFAQEVRRFYPFAPFVAGRTVRETSWQGRTLPAGTLLLLDLYGQDHDAGLWTDPYRFSPERFLDRPPHPDELVPQGGGPADTGHRCPGEDVTVGLLRALVPRLARLDYRVPPQDLAIPLRRIPSRPGSGFVICDVRPAAA